MSYQASLADEPASAKADPDIPRLYSPFDEPKPKAPAEIHSDKRLETMVTISVKSKNMKDLFWEIRRQTGVNVVVDKELSGERPIVFFHDKSLRDVMTEISALYGYYWLAKGRKGAWTYELFEDMIHAKRRTQVRDSQEAVQVNALLDCIDVCSKTLENEAALERLRQTNLRLYIAATNPPDKAILQTLSLMDRGTIRALMSDVGMAWDFPKLSPEMQAGVLDIVNAGLERQAAADFQPRIAEEMKSALVRFKRWRANLFTPLHIVVTVTIPAKADGTGGMKYYREWPQYREGEPDLLSMAEAPQGRVIGGPLPAGAKITVEQTRKQLYNGSILVTDVLSAIAEQAKLNVIADYYFQEISLSACSDEPLDKLVAEICRKMDYTCQIEEDTLRFRCNKWYLQPLPEEPPASMQEHWWSRVTETGGLLLDDLIDIACLPDRQTFWGGFRFIPQAHQARLFPRTARMVRMLGPALENRACTPTGLRVSELDSDQFSRLADWAGVVGVDETPEDLFKSTIRIEKSGEPANRLQFILVLPDGTPRIFSMTMQLDRLNETARLVLAQERASELAADRIGLCLHGN